jgi:hypothetical protein
LVLAGQEESLGRHDSTDSPRKPSASDQHKRFVETARELGCGEDEAAEAGFREKLKRIAAAKPKPERKSRPKKTDR